MFLAANASVSSTASNATRQVFVRDTCLGAANCTPTTTRVSGASAPVPVAEDQPAISRDGRYVAYTSSQSGSWQILLSDTCWGESGCTRSTRVVSVAADGSAGDGASHNPVMTVDGRYIAFSSAATNLVANAPLGRQVYLRDTCAGATESCKASTLLVSTDEARRAQRNRGDIAVFERLCAVCGISCREPWCVRRSYDAEQRTAAGVCARHVPGCDGLRPEGHPNFPAAGLCSRGERETSRACDCGIGETNCSGGMVKSATMFTPTVAVDDRVLLAIPNGNN